MKASIYKIQNIINNKCYIGFTVDIERRIRDHKNMNTNKDKRYKKILYDAFRVYGVENFIFETVYESKDVEHTLGVMEPYFIKKFQAYAGNGTGYNLTMGGEGCPGFKFTDKQRVRVSIESKRRWNDPEYRAKYEGKEHSQQRKDRISESLKKTWAVRGHNSKGVPKSEEQKKKISESCKKAETYKYAIEANRKRMSKEWLIIHPNGKREEITNLREFCKIHNLSPANMRKVAIGLLTHHHQFKCSHK